MEKELQVTEAAKDVLQLASAMGQSVSSAGELEKVMQKIQSTVKTTVKHVRSFVADFDELQRLPEKEVSVTTTVKEDETQLLQSITDGSLAYRIRQMTKDTEGLFAELYEKMELTNRRTEDLDQRMMSLYRNLSSVGSYVQSVLLQTVERLGQSMIGLLSPSTQVAQALEAQTIGIQTLSRAVAQGALPAVQALNGNLKQLGQQQTSVPQWSSHWSAMAQTVRQYANEMIRYCNGLMSAVAETINTMGRFSAAIPGSTYKPVHVSPPKIPALAQGAVLPANRPFLAMVGDQRHGTNVEAPLATIQEAVAAVTADQTGAIVAGFEASVGVQREILEAVLGISIGDETVAKACRRYEQKMAVVRGG